jgi:hypothetical protein
MRSVSMERVEELMKQWQQEKNIVPFEVESENPRSRPVENTGAVDQSADLTASRQKRHSVNNLQLIECLVSRFDDSRHSSDIRRSLNGLTTSKLIELFGLTKA